MTHECVFFNGEGAVQCNRVVAYPKLRETLGCQQGDRDFIGLAQAVCKESTDDQRKAECPAFSDIKEFLTNSSYSRRLSK